MVRDEKGKRTKGVWKNRFGWLVGWGGCISKRKKKRKGEKTMRIFFLSFFFFSCVFPLPSHRLPPLFSHPPPSPSSLPVSTTPFSVSVSASGLVFPHPPLRPPPPALFLSFFCPYYLSLSPFRRRCRCCCCCCFYSCLQGTMFSLDLDPDKGYPPLLDLQGRGTS